MKSRPLLSVAAVIALSLAVVISAEAAPRRKASRKSPLGNDLGGAREGSDGDGGDLIPIPEHYLLHDDDGDSDDFEDYEDEDDIVGGGGGGGKEIIKDAAIVLKDPYSVSAQIEQPTRERELSSSVQSFSGEQVFPRERQPAWQPSRNAESLA